MFCISHLLLSRRFFPRQKAGLIALIWSKNPELTPNEVESILKLTTDDVGIQGPWNTAYGRINSFKAVSAAGSGTPFVSSKCRLQESLAVA